MSQISELSIEELKDLQLEAAKLIEIKEEQAIEDAYFKIISIAESVRIFSRGSFESRRSEL